MGRTLPWKKQQSGGDARISTTASVSVSNNSRTITNPDHSSPSPRLDHPSTPTRLASPSAANTSSIPNPTSFSRPRISAPATSRRARAPSSSPPPQHPLQLPESLMIPGLLQDDRWRMVEDEFVATAHRFTAHLHAAEYHRLKELAKIQKKDDPSSALLPIAASATDNVKRIHNAQRLAISQHSGLKRALSRVKDADQDDLDDTPWAGTHLHNLMESPRKKPISLTRVASVTTGTRAAALSRSQDGDSRARTQPTRSISGNRPPRGAQQSQFSSISLGSNEARSISGSTSFNQTQGMVTESSRLTDTAKPLAISGDRPLKRVQAAIPSTVVSKDEDDSDSSIENDFWRLRGDHRRQAPVSRSKSATSNDSSQASLPVEDRKASRTATNKALSIPSI